VSTRRGAGAEGRPPGCSACRVVVQDADHKPRKLNARVRREGGEHLVLDPRQDPVANYDITRLHRRAARAAEQGTRSLQRAHGHLGHGARTRPDRALAVSRRLQVCGGLAPRANWREYGRTPSMLSTPYRWADRLDPNILVFSVSAPCLSYTSPTECPRLRASMQHTSVHHRTGRSFGKGASAPRLAPRRPRAGRRTARRTRGRAAPAAGRGRRRVLIFYAVAASLAGELAAIAVDMEALVLLFSLTGLFLCTVIFRAAKR